MAFNGDGLKAKGANGSSTHTEKHKIPPTFIHSLKIDSHMQ